MEIDTWKNKTIPKYYKEEVKEIIGLLKIASYILKVASEDMSWLGTDYYDEVTDITLKVEKLTESLDKIWKRKKIDETEIK